jgi:hypothetical protein
LHEQQYQFQQCVKKDNQQNLHLDDGDALCSVPLNILAPKLTLLYITFDLAQPLFFLFLDQNFKMTLLHQFSIDCLET